MKAILSKFSKRERTLFVGTVSVILAAALFIFIFEPIYTQWSQVKVDFQVAHLRLYKNLKLLAEQEVLEKEYETFKDFFLEGEDESQGTPNILKEIESIAVSSGVKITSIKPKGEKEFENYKKYNVEVVVEGEINQLLKFMYSLEGSKRFLKVERLVLALKGRKGNTLKGTLIIRKISFI